MAPTHPVERCDYVHSWPAKQRLRGASAIGDFIGVSRRQVFRLKAEGLPVWREGDRGSPLLAEIAEILEWLKHRRDHASVQQVSISSKQDR